MSIETGKLFNFKRSRKMHVGFPGMTHRLLEALNNAGVVYEIKNPDTAIFEVTKAGTSEKGTP